MENSQRRSWRQDNHPASICKASVSGSTQRRRENWKVLCVSAHWRAGFTIGHGLGVTEKTPKGFRHSAQPCHDEGGATLGGESGIEIFPRWDSQMESQGREIWKANCVYTGQIASRSGAPDYLLQSIKTKFPLPVTTPAWRCGLGLAFDFFSPTGLS